MSKVSQSLLKGAREALAYVKGRRKGAEVHKLQIPDKINVRCNRGKF